MSEQTWLMEQFARFIYKPGWSWEVEVSAVLGTLAYPQPRLQITAVQPDACDPGRGTTTITAQRSIPQFYEMRDMDPQIEYELARWFLHTLWDMERHESEEWLRRDGEVLFNPHKEGARR